MFQDSRCSVTDMLQTQVFTYVESVSAPPKSLSIHFDNSRCSVIDVFQAQIPMLKVFQPHHFIVADVQTCSKHRFPYVEVAPPKHFNIIKTSQSIVSIQFQLESFAGHDFNGIIPSQDMLILFQFYSFTVTRASQSIFFKSPAGASFERKKSPKP